MKSKIATNGLAWFKKNIDHENSVHREAYAAELHASKPAAAYRAPSPARKRSMRYCATLSFPGGRARTMW